MPSNSHSPKYPVQTLEKALDIVEILSKVDGGEGLGVTELSKRLGIGKSTIHRILDTLAGYRYVEKTPANKYRLSWRLFELGASVPHQRSLNNIDAADLQGLCDKHGETVNVGVRVGDGVVIISKVNPETALRASLEVGTREPIHPTALGKVLTSEMDEQQVRALLGSEMQAHTNQTITSPDAFIKELEKVREQGYAIDNEEFCFGLSCISMPIRNYNGQIVAAISVTGPSFRMSFSKIMEIKDDLREVTKKISAHLGHERASGETAAARIE
ncbi:IclR family transcriptional regulator [Metallumcola ferriviriculae]|uniref:IclR family transcriptional regulator n=1 Tax=Metallumcola ferriviriculae TaxID=3039180 RepID=A0AAU0UQF0_9FIRM|nr:IclR family transcriptional regulator [Desulfitibacteraceae bacterium MK1]